MGVEEPAKKEAKVEGKMEDEAPPTKNEVRPVTEGMEPGERKRSIIAEKTAKKFKGLTLKGFGGFSKKKKTADVDINDRPVLEEFYKSTNGESWKDNENWLSDKPIGMWAGVTTNDDGRVTAICLRRNEMKGTLPANLEGLNQLQILDLEQNEISGCLPPNIRKCTNLIMVNLGYNEVSGSIPPTIGHLHKLAFLRLNNNQLQGEIPQGLGYCKAISELHLQCNTLTGSLPAKLASCGKLQDLRVYDNELGGRVPEEYWEDTPSLQIFSLSLNDHIASEFCSLHNQLNAQLMCTLH
jgi:Leucine-rich repeat (LRR) protein